ncbi:MAG: Hsp20/alpha crystallin family protein [Actinomycetota bacterium]|nr:Hsp20/alpha crystallin family protein [Actinomycetota bacterium]
MAPMRWDPFDEFRFPAPRRRLHPLSQWFEDFPEAPWLEKEWFPKVDVFDKGNDLVIKAEVPGVKPEDIGVTLEDGALTIRGKSEKEEKVERDDYYRLERSYGSFMRSIPVPRGVKESDITAESSDGVLEVRLKGAAKLGKAARKAIPVKASSKKTNKKKTAKKK